MASGTKIRTAKQVIPKIYAYITPEIERHDGWIKIGYTEQDVLKRLEQQTHTADVEYELKWDEPAIYNDGTGDIFRDTDFHAYLRKQGVKQDKDKDNEWFEISDDRSHRMFFDFIANRGILAQTEAVIPYRLRKEQSDAVARTSDYFNLHSGAEFLWNAKPRFGKTLTTYDLCKKLNADNILVVTNRPAIANSWYEDYVKFLGDKSGYRFVSDTDSLQGRKYVLTRGLFQKYEETHGETKCIEFVSLQDLKGSIYFGGKHNKLSEVKDQKWDLLVIDEAHEGVDTYKTDIAFDHIRRKWTLHLSGTPFKALASDKFPEKAIYNWTYADEQEAKRNWKGEPGEENPYASLPRLNMFTYQMSEIVRGEVKQGIDIDGVNEEYAFDLNEFFRCNKSGEFVHDEDVDQFLNALTEQEKFPFSTEVRGELRHTFWLLNRVDSAKALARKLRKHPVFGRFEIILAAGNGKLDDQEETVKSYDKVTRAIRGIESGEDTEHIGTITLSVGQLTTGVTVPEWTGVLMLSNMKSPSLYMQAAFRAQNPCMFRKGTDEYYRKINAYVFDFDPARTLNIYEQFANDLISDTASGKGDSGTRKEHVRRLLNYYPVYGEDHEGRMIELDAEKVMSIPRKIRSREVVSKGFMSDFLFQNITNVFHANKAVWDIINKIEPVKDQGYLVPDDVEGVAVDEDGNVVVPKERVIGEAHGLFGEKIYETDPDNINDLLDKVETNTDPSETDDKIAKLATEFGTNVTTPMLETAKERYGSDLTASSRKRLQRKINGDFKTAANKVIGNLRIEQVTLDTERDDKLKKASTEDEKRQITEEYEQKQADAVENCKKEFTDKVNELVTSAGQDIVETVLTDKQNEKKGEIEGTVRDHLRGFSRTIPSFLMAYGGDNKITLANIDKIVPDDVFRDVTSISLNDFRFLRDGGPYVDNDTGVTEHFDGHLFDEVVFNDSVKEFLGLKKKLADYFDESASQDIFDYIPPQKTNQIFTPKKVVVDMVDKLEEENPGCFDDEYHTFADLYMKSGLYLAEIVKRLYRSERLKTLYPNKMERLEHIFEKQVYGLAPTEIIYRIVISFLLGFSNEIKIEKHNIRQLDSLEYAKNGKLEETLKEIYGIRPE